MATASGSDAGATSPPTVPPTEASLPSLTKGGTTGNKWTDFQLALKSISVWDDLQNIGSIPCARNSLLSGIASGAGMGVVRGLNAGPLIASNWAVGTFLVISLGTWTICQKSRVDERKRLQQIVDEIPRRRVKRGQEGDQDGGLVGAEQNA